MEDGLEKKLVLDALQQGITLMGRPRFFFQPKPKPWYWVFAWWLKKWSNYGDFIPIKSDDPRYETAPYEMGIVYSEKLVVKSDARLPVVFILNNH